MGSLFEIAKSGIQAYRQALAVTGQNIANVNTEGYSKRDVALEEIGGVQGGVTDVSDQSGLGVRVDEIRRSFNEYITERLRSAHSSYEQIKQFSTEVNILENDLLPEGSDLSTFIGKFFSSLQEIGAAPEDSAPRTVAMEAGKDLSNAFNDNSARLNQTQRGAFTQTNLVLDKVNLLSTELENVNAKLKSAGATTKANDLLDTRDLLLEQLSKEIEFTTTYGDRGDVTIRLGNSGQGPILVSPNNSFKLRAKVTENSDFRYAFETTVNNISIFIVDGVEEKSTTQITGGKLAGLVNFYAYVQEVRSSIDDIAFRLAKDFNEVQKNGKDLTGEVGKDMFMLGLPEIERNLIAGSDMQVSLDQKLSVVNLKKDVEFNFDGTKWTDNNNKVYKEDTIDFEGLTMTISGTPVKGDSFKLLATENLSSSLKFNLKSGNEFAASAFKLAESNTNNLGTGELNIESNYIVPESGIAKLESIFANSENSLLGTSFLKEGVVASIGKNISELSLKSFGLQPQAQFVITDEDAKTINSFSLALADGNTVSVTFGTNDKGHKVLSVKDLADILNSGISPGGASFSFSSYGLVASGSNGALTIASGDQNFTSSSISTRSSGTINAIVSNPTASEKEASNIQIFTREGKHIAGVPLKVQDYAALITEDNGFFSDAVYNAEYINQDYRNIDIEATNVESDFILITGHSASRSSNPVSAQTISVDTFNDGIIDKTLSIPVSSSSEFTLKEFKENASKTGIAADAVTRVSLDPIDVVVSGTASMSIAAGVRDAVSVSATILPDDLSNLVTELNKVAEITGVTATLTLDKKRIILENSDAEDILITNFNAPNSTTATVLDQYYAATSSSVSLSSATGSNSAVFTGAIRLSSAVDFALTSSDGSSNLTGDALRKGFDNARGIFEWSDTGETLTIDHLSFGTADKTASSNDGTFASKGTGVVHFKLPAVDGSSVFMSQVNLDNLETITSEEVLKAHLKDIRDEAPDIRVVGNVINTLPSNGTKLSIEFEDQTYTLETKESQVTITGGEEGRLNGFFTPVSGWSGANTDEITSENSLVVSSGNTLTISVDGTASGTITLPAATYSSNSAVASALQTAINADSTLISASKSVSVKWTGTKYEIVSNTGRQTYSITDTTVASVKVTAIDDTIEGNLKLSTTNGGKESINGYQLGIVGAGSLSASKITFPSNSQNTTSKTILGLDDAVSNIEGKAVTNNPTNRDYFDIKVKTGSWTSGIVSDLSSASITLSGTNTIELKVDDVASGTITVPNATYSTNANFAAELEEAINKDSTLLTAGKSVSVLYQGTSGGYQIVSNNSTTSAAVEVTSVSTDLETHTKFTAVNGGIKSNSSKYRVKYTDAAWLGGEASIATSSSAVSIPNTSSITFQLKVDGIDSGTISLTGGATYYSNVDIARVLEQNINADSNLSTAGVSVEVKWTGSAYKIISNGTTSQDVILTSIDSDIESILKLSSTNGGAQNDNSFDLYDATGSGSRRTIYLNGVNFGWNSTDKNISITRKLDTSPLHEVSFVEDSTNNEKFGLKVHPYTIGLVDNKIRVSSNNGKPVAIDFDQNVSKGRVGHAIKLENLPSEELIIVIQGGGTARRVSASFSTKQIDDNDLKDNLTFTVDSTNNKKIHIKDSDTGHTIAERTLSDTGRFKIAGYNLKIDGTPNKNDSFIISDNLGGVGDGRNILAMLDLQEDKYALEGKGNFQELFSEVVASVGASVQSTNLNLSSSEMIKDAAAASASELSGVNMDEEAAQLIEYQQAYQASARVLQTARELFDALIDRI